MTDSQPDLDFETVLPPGQQWFTIHKLAEYWGLSTQHIINLVQEGRFTFNNVGPVNFSGAPTKTRATTRIPRACIIAFLKANKL